MAERDDEKTTTGAEDAGTAGTFNGISNRETPADEEQERRAHPTINTESPQPEDAAGRVGEEPLEDLSDRHTSHKAGVVSVAQKEEGSKYADRGMPQTHKVPGAFGKEPGDPEPPDIEGAKHSH